MITSELKAILKRKLRQPIAIDDLNVIAIEMGKKRPLQSRSSGGTSYQWTENEIPVVIHKLNNN